MFKRELKNRLLKLIEIEEMNVDIYTLLGNLQISLVR